MDHRLVILLCLLLGIQLPASLAQRSHAISGGLGTAYYYGDLTDKFNNSLIRLSYQLNYQRYLSPWFSLRFGLTHSQIGASDAQATNPAKQARNLHFRSPLTELSAVGVIELPDKNFNHLWKDKTHLTPYLFGGIALFTFKPMAFFQGRWYELQPFGTEGQHIGNSQYPRPYSLLQISIPFGIGLSYRFRPGLGLNLEVGYRKTFTDYLDDVSTIYPDPDALIQASGPQAWQLSNRTGDQVSGGEIRGNPGAKDSYFFTMVGVSIYLRGRY